MRSTFYRLAIALILTARLLASDQYVQPGGLNQPIQHWKYPDFNTMSLDTGFFSQDVNKVALEADNNSYWYLNSPVPGWQWFGGGPLNFDPLNFNLYVTQFQSQRTGFQINNLSSNSGAYASLRITSNGTQGEVGVYSSTYSGGFPTTVANGLTISNNAGPIILNPGVGSVTVSGGNSSIPLINASIADQTGFAADQYLTGSEVTSTAGDWRAKGQYHCVFDMVKTAAGVAAPTIIVRMGTAGTTSDPAILTLTWGAGSATADTGTFDIWVTFRSVGSGTTAVIQGVTRLTHLQSGVGLTTTTGNTAQISGLSAGFASTTQTKLGLSFNGGASFSGTCHLVQSELKQ
jgi:hypothetical protein